MIQSGKNIKVVMITALFVAAIAFGSVMLFSSNSYSQQQSLSAASGVKHLEVCMVTDRVFGKPQIPVTFDGKTYYGCCQGCVSKIKNNRAVRYSTDPVTGREVDKATAYILEGPGGEALYFESAETAKKYTVPGQAG